jgi:hypothetical protein
VQNPKHSLSQSRSATPALRYETPKERTRDLRRTRAEERRCKIGEPNAEGRRRTAQGWLGGGNTRRTHTALHPGALEVALAASRRSVNPGHTTSVVFPPFGLGNLALFHGGNTGSERQSFQSLEHLSQAPCQKFGPVAAAAVAAAIKAAAALLIFYRHSGEHHNPQRPSSRASTATRGSSLAHPALRAGLYSHCATLRAALRHGRR